MSGSGGGSGGGGVRRGGCSGRGGQPRALQGCCRVGVDGARAENAMLKVEMTGWDKCEAVILVWTSCVGLVGDGRWGRIVVRVDGGRSSGFALLEVRGCWYLVAGSAGLRLEESCVVESRLRSVDRGQGAREGSGPGGAGLVESLSGE